jgi:hypothetical protein
MSWVCRHLFYENGIAGCRLHGRLQPRICEYFPIDTRDLADRDAASPDSACGFWWEE